jgi:hypothetical protein
MLISSIPKSAGSFKKLGAIQIGDKIRLVKSSKLEQTLFSNPQNAQIFKNNISSMQAVKYLSVFGKYAKNVELDPTHLYQYSNGHGKAGIYDLTANKCVINGVKELSKPIKTFIGNVLKKIQNNI